ncbi:YgaP family membrane protein [Puniceibacterium confluentis]|uniref:YgaP family membrane protein n=1 Tax=Puniceibacterium confluentis TaxID=1958944 RepID=UPI0035621819
MTINMGAADRVIRLIVGTVLILAPVFNLFGMTASTPAIVASVIAGIVLVLTAFFRFCPLYRVVGASTCKR